MFEEESKKGVYIYALSGVAILVLLVALLVAFWPASDTSDVYVGVCGDSHCDPLELSEETCPEDCPVEAEEEEEVVEEEPEEEPEEEEPDVNVDILDINFDGVEDEDAEFTITLLNDAGDDAEDFEVDVTLTHNGDEVDTCSVSISSLEHDETKDISCTFDVSSIMDEEDDITVDARVGSKGLELTFDWGTSMFLPDLIIDDIDFSVEDNSTMEVSVTVKNDGSVDIDDPFISEVVLYIEDDREDECSTSPTEIDELDSGDAYTFTCEIDLSGNVADDVLDNDLDIEIRVVVDHDDDIEESDEDNEFTETGELTPDDFEN